MQQYRGADAEEAALLLLLLLLFRDSSTLELDASISPLPPFGGSAPLGMEVLILIADVSESCNS